MVEILRKFSKGLFDYANSYLPASSPEAKYILRSNFITLFVFAMVILFIPIFIWLNAPIQSLSAVGVFLSALMVLILNKRAPNSVGRLFQLLVFGVWLLYYARVFGEGSAAHYLYLAFAVIPLILFPVNRYGVYIPTFLIYLVLFWLVESDYFDFEGMLSQADQASLRTIVFNLLFFWVFANFWLYNRSNEIYERIMQKALRRVQLKNAEMEQFVHIASHDLQEPLQTLRSFVELSRDVDENTEEEQALYLEQIDVASLKMTGLIKALMNHSRLGNLQSEKEMLDLNDLLSSIQQEIEGRLGKDMAKIQFKRLPSLMVNYEDLKTVFEELLWNAIKFTPADRIANIEVKSSKEGSHHLFEVRDNGKGILGPNADKVFEIFRRLDHSGTTAGIGAGLAHVKKIVQSYDGDIRFKNNEDDEGTTIYFTLLVSK